MRTNQTKKHEGHDDLTGEYKWGDLGQVILLFIFLAIWILDSFFWRYTIFLSESIPGWTRIMLGSVVLIIAWTITRSGLKIIFGEKRESPQVIRKGVFSIVRHPIYLGAILLYPGLIFFTFSLLATGFWLIIISFYVFIARYEEKILTEQFGNDYILYKNEVPMLFPFFK